MILYNTIVGLAAGVGLLLVARLLKKLCAGDKIQPEGWSLSFAMTGFILTVLGITISVMWPYTLVLHANIMFGEPALAFGVLLLAASFFMWREREVFAELGGDSKKSSQALAHIVNVLRPVSVWVFAIGLMMTALAIAIFHYRLGAAPPQEPISGHFSNQPLVEGTFLTALWGLVALGSLLFPAGLMKWNRDLLRVVYMAWGLAGVLFLLFSALNYFTHIGLLINTVDHF